MNLIDKLISDESQKFANKIKSIVRDEQRLLDCASVCRDLNNAAAELRIDFESAPLVTVCENAIYVAAHSCDHITIAKVSEILDAASYLYRIESVAQAGWENDGKAIAFGIEGYVDQLIIRDPKHVDLVTASEALEFLERKAA